MSQKKSREKRDKLRYCYEVEINRWLHTEPPKIFVFRHRRWKKRKPTWKEVEKKYG